MSVSGDPIASDENDDSLSTFSCTGEREKFRQKNVSEAFEQLRGLVPAPPNKKLSKHEILKMAIRYIKVLLRIIEWQKNEKHVNNLIWKETSSSYQRTSYRRSNKSNVVYYMNKEFKSTLIVKIPEKKFSKRVSFSKVARTKTIVSVIQKNKQ